MKKEECIVCQMKIEIKIDNCEEYLEKGDLLCDDHFADAVEWYGDVLLDRDIDNYLERISKRMDESA